MQHKLMKLLGANVIYNHADFRLLSKKAMSELSEYKETESSNLEKEKKSQEKIKKCLTNTSKCDILNTSKEKRGISNV